MEYEAMVKTNGLVPHLLTCIYYLTHAIKTKQVTEDHIQYYSHEVLKHF